MCKPHSVAVNRNGAPRGCPSARMVRGLRAGSKGDARRPKREKALGEANRALVRSWKHAVGNHKAVNCRLVAPEHRHRSAGRTLIEQHLQAMSAASKT